MRTFEFGGLPVRDGIVRSFERCWERLAAPGTWLTATEQVEVAARTRAVFTDADAADDSLSHPRREAIDVLAGRPAVTSEAWVDGITGAIGELVYVELAGIVARVVAIDTFCHLCGLTPPPFPEPAAGEPSRIDPPANLRRNRTWVSMEAQLPPLVLGAVPDAVEAMNEVSIPLYMDVEAMMDPAWERRGFDRRQAELVAATVSHVNECFY